MKIVKGFPYMLCVDTEKIQKFLGEFKKYKMTKAQITNICVNSGGLLASTRSNFFGLFETMRKNGIDARETIKIIDTHPKFALQNQKDLFKRKIDIILKESGKDEIYMRNFIKRHPDIIMR